MRFTNNAARHNTYGINGEFFSYGNGILNEYFPGAETGGNYLSGAASSRYPSGTRVAGPFEGEFVDAAAGDFRLVGGSQLRGTATDGGDIGVDMGTLLFRVANVEGGVPGVPPISAPSNVRVVGG
jgi:hypothetical protein